MKKQPKAKVELKLELKRAVVKPLTNVDLGGVAGGGFTMGLTNAG